MMAGVDDRNAVLLNQGLTSASSAGRVISHVELMQIQHRRIFD